MERVLEPELMDEPEQALAHASLDFSVPHRTFVKHFQGLFPDFVGNRLSPTIADLGCGTADVTIHLAKAFPNALIIGLDGAEAMLKHGEQAVKLAEVDKRVTLLKCQLPNHRLPAIFDAVVSNSTLHHLPDPQVMWRSIRELGKPSAAVMVMDLVRPGSNLRAQELVDIHAYGAPDRIKEDFFHSLKAAFLPEEVEQQLAEAGLNLEIELVSNRHMLIHGQL